MAGLRGGHIATVADVTSLVKKYRTSGSVSLAGGASQNFPIVFPVGLFTSAPFVGVQCGNARLSVGLSGLTSAGVTITIANWTAGATGTTTFWVMAEE